MGFFLFFLRVEVGGFPGRLVVRTLLSHCQGPGFNPWSGTEIPSALWCGKKKKKKKRVEESDLLCYFLNIYSLFLAVLGLSCGMWHI